MVEPDARRRRSEHHQAEALSKSRIYLDYQEAFNQGTGLPLGLHPPEMLRLVRYPKKQENRFCALMAETSKACAACYALQLELVQAARIEAKTLKCFAGLCESAVPVRVGQNVIAFLHTGQVVLQPLTRGQFSQVARRLLRCGASLDLKLAEEMYFQTRVLRPAQYESLVRLLTIFAVHLGACANELALRPPGTEPAAVAKARRFITAYHSEEISLSRVAQVVNTSATYFSKRFKEVAGMTFVDYLGRVRVEKAKALLRNPSLRISTVALEVGFQSLSQFNRTFRKVTGRSPKEFRARGGLL